MDARTLRAVAAGGGALRGVYAIGDCASKSATRHAHMHMNTCTHPFSPYSGCPTVFRQTTSGGAVARSRSQFACCPRLPKAVRAVSSLLRALGGGVCGGGECCCSCSTCGLPSIMMALITSDCDTMRIHAHPMALITSNFAQAIGREIAAEEDCSSSSSSTAEEAALQVDVAFQPPAQFLAISLGRRDGMLLVRPLPTPPTPPTPTPPTPPVTFISSRRPRWPSSATTCVQHRSRTPATPAQQRVAKPSFVQNHFPKEHRNQHHEHLFLCSCAQRPGERFDVARRLPHR